MNSNFERITEKVWQTTAMATVIAELSDVNEFTHGEERPLEVTTNLAYLLRDTGQEILEAASGDWELDTLYSDVFQAVIQAKTLAALAEDADSSPDSAAEFYSAAWVAEDLFLKLREKMTAEAWGSGQEERRCTDEPVPSNPKNTTSNRIPIWRPFGDPIYNKKRERRKRNENRAAKNGENTALSKTAQKVTIRPHTPW